MGLDAEAIFATYLLPLYPPGVQADPSALARARSNDPNPIGNPELAARITAHLEDAATVFAHMAPQLFGADLALDRSDASIHRLGAALTRERRDAWAASGDAGTPESALFNVIVHGVAYLGATIVKSHAGEWRAKSPLWESRVHLVSSQGEAELSLLQWWVKSLSDEGFENGAGLADRYRMLVEEPTRDRQALPILFTSEQDRTLPRLQKVRYDLFYKWLKAHLPEVRDVGEGFPSPERFDELDFKWLDGKILGGGRSLLLYGLGGNGLHLFWLGEGGFEKALFYPAESFPEPIVRVKSGPDIAGEKLEVILSIDGQPTVHEMLWGGL